MKNKVYLWLLFISIACILAYIKYPIGLWWLVAYVGVFIISLLFTLSSQGGKDKKTVVIHRDMTDLI